MACGKRCRPDDGFDVQHFFLKAKRGWLKPAEICEIIRNHENFGILTEPVKMPPGGSFFLYNRKELRRFRNDGYRWKKPKDGKASKEGHERLKVGDVEVLHCYYAHREENGNFHRRSYWTIDHNLTHIALVHYLELTHIALVLEVEASESETAFTLTTAVGELTEAQTGNLLGPESAYNHQTSVWSQPSLELQQPMAQKNNAELDNLNRLINTGDYWNTFEIENEVDKSSAPLQVHWDSYMLAPSVLHDQLFSIIDLSPNWAYENFSRKVFIRGRFLKNEQAESCKWSCMFGEVEVPAQVKADGLCCYTPVHKAGRLPFYVTCSNRIACSEVREFEYLVFQRRADIVPLNTWVEFPNSTACSKVGAFEHIALRRRARRVPHVRTGRLLPWDSLRLAPINPMANCCGLNRLLKKLFGKLLAFRGRERTVSSLVTLDADPEALTDPTTKHPTGETPADLASEQGHKRIAGYLAESALSAHLSSLNLDGKEGNSAEISGAKAVSASSRDGELTDGISLIPVSASAEQALSLIEVKSHKAGRCVQHVDSAAIRIQNKFRSWKGRKDFLIIRQQIIKIQAHVRGHQVRKNCRKMVWSVGIVEKIILRWRGKGSGLRGFKPEPLPEGPSMQVSSSKDDDYDLLTEGRKKTEERLQKALARVKSMVQYPEARDQYHQLLNVVTEIQENKVLNTSEGTSAYMDDDLIDIEALFDEDIFMPTAS